VSRETTPDLFDGTFDNRRTGHREVWMDGRLRRHAGKNCAGDQTSDFDEMHHPWGHYPDLPSNAAGTAAGG
jgi:hypothetical protein